MNDDQAIYAVRLLLAAQHEAAPAPEALFEERIILVVASDDDEAVRLGRQSVEARPETYRKAAGEPVSWVFHEVLDVKSLVDREFRDGMEAYYCLLDDKGVDDLRRALRP